MRRCRSFISSKAVSVYLGADLTTLRATCRFILAIAGSDSGIAGDGDILLIFGEPYGREMTPAKLPDHDVSPL